MKKEILTVPKGIRYISDWKEFTFNRFDSKCIIDKQIPGCGYTEWCIRNDQDIILTSPRRILLQNKEEQHRGEVFLALNNLDYDTNVDRDMNRIPKKIPNYKIPVFEPEEKKQIYEDLCSRLDLYRQECVLKGTPMKILVTYDSYGMVKSILEFMKVFDKFYTVVDEFQSLLHDSRFKSTTELKFMNILGSVEKVHFVSATPTLDKYLIRLSDFRDLPYYELDWSTEDPYRVLRPDIITRTMKSVGTKAKEIIQKYQDGNYEKVVMPSGKVVISDEAVFYVNSVNHIITIIRSSELKPFEVNILCSNTPENRAKIKKLNSKDDLCWRGPENFEIGQVPLKGVKPKKYTFCTRTVYLGADFYSECARSFVFSDSNLDCLAVDVLQDLPQIMGRQRLNTNPWKNQCWFFVKSTIEKLKEDPDFFKAYLKNKVDETNSLISSCIGLQDEKDKRILAERYERLATVDNYRKDYVAINYINSMPTPVLNEYAYVSDIRAFDIQQGDYASQFNVFALVSQLSHSCKDQEVNDFFDDYQKIRSISDKLRAVCEFIFSHTQEQGELVIGLLNDIDIVKKYITTVGPEKCRSLGYHTGKLHVQEGLMEINQNNIDVSSVFDQYIGKSLPNSVAKELLQAIYDSYSYKIKAKASDLANWYEIKPAKITSDSGDRVNGIFIIKRK